MKEVKLKSDIGIAKAGTIFVRGLHGIPEYYENKSNPKYFPSKPDDWYWEKGSKKEECKFFYKNALKDF